MGIEFRTEQTAFKIDFDDLTALRANIREGFGGAGLISADVEKYQPKNSSQNTTKSIRGMSIITKLPQIPKGMSYNGLIFLPFKDFSYSIYVRYEEAGTTGLREAIVLDLLMEEGAVTIDPNAPPPGLQGLAEDLYDKTLRGPLVRSKCEREEYDHLFPDHPLSRVRACLVRIKESLVIDDGVLDAEQLN